MQQQVVLGLFRGDDDDHGSVDYAFTHSPTHMAAFSVNITRFGYG